MRILLNRVGETRCTVEHEDLESWRRGGDGGVGGHYSAVGGRICSCCVAWGRSTIISIPEGADCTSRPGFQADMYDTLELIAHCTL